MTLSRRYGANSPKGRPNHSMHPTGAKSAAAGDARSLSVCSEQIIVATLERLKWVGYRLLDILVA